MEARINLQLNPTRFFRYNHHVTDFTGDPTVLMERLPSNPSLYRESGFAAQDNWIPLHARLWGTIHRRGWDSIVGDYLRTVREALKSEFDRVGAISCTGEYPNAEAYNVRVVETYWEWIAPNPLKIVDDLSLHLSSFSDRRTRRQTYRPPPDEEGTEHSIPVLKVETAPGEFLKIYAKTNHRIRIEVVHTLQGRNRFQFPREADTQGVMRRSSAHTFTSLQGVLLHFNRLRNRAAEVVNSFLTHVSRMARLEPTAITAFQALFDITRAIPDDYPTALTLLTHLVQDSAIPAGGDEAKRTAIAALRAHGIIEPSGRGMYIATARYRMPFERLRIRGNFPILTARERRRGEAEGNR